MEAPIDWAVTRVVAGILLCAYGAVAAVQFGRESRFIAGVEMPAKAWFISQNLLIQLAVLLCLLPVTLTPAPSKPAVEACLAGLTLLWLVGIWTVVSRRVYTYRLLLGARSEHDKLIQELMARGRQTDEGAAPPPPAEKKEDG